MNMNMNMNNNLYSSRSSALSRHHETVGYSEQEQWSAPDSVCSICRCHLEQSTSLNWRCSSRCSRGSYVVLHQFGNVTAAHLKTVMSGNLLEPSLKVPSMCVICPQFCISFLLQDVAGRIW